MSRLRSLAEIYPDEAGFIESIFMPAEVKLARIRQMCLNKTVSKSQRSRTIENTKAPRPRNAQPKSTSHDHPHHRSPRHHPPLPRGAEAGGRVVSALHPLHFSLGGKSRHPHMMESINLPHEQIEAVERVALDIFADMSNAGWPLQKALAAIYFTGVQHTLAITNGEDL